MPKSTYFKNAILALIFNGESISGLADNAATDPLTDLYLSLHTAYPGEDGDQTTNESAYSGYERMPLERSVAGWTVTDNTVSPTADVQFPYCLSGTETIMYVGIGTTVASASELIYIGVLSPNIEISAGMAPILTTGSTLSET